MSIPDLEEDARVERELRINRQIALASGLFQDDVTVRTILESLAEGIVIVDDSGTTLLANTRIEQMFGYSKKDLVGNPLAVLVPERFRQLYEVHLAQFFAEPRMIPMVYQGTMRMNSLIEALLNFSRMGRVEPRRDMFDLGMLAHEVAESLKLTEPDRQVDFKIPDGIVADGDASLLRVVLDNLLGNAWKYSKMREKAIIEFGVRDISGEPTYFIRDNGAGFDMTDADKLFTPFQRLPGAETQKGFGIGLATVERIISRHGGKVWAEGEPGKGACIYFTLALHGKGGTHA